MQTPAPLAGPPDLQVSEAATPGASVAAVRGEHDHVLETPEFDTPGQASPARHRSNEGGRSLVDGAQLDSSRSRSAGLHAAAAALAEVAAAPAAAAAAAEPLSKPRLRVQGADIILEDAASPKDAAENGGGAAHRPPQEQPRPQQLAAGAAAAAGGAGAGASAAGQQPAAPPTQQQQQQQPQQPQQHVQPPPLNLAAMRVSQAHEHELQLRLASRTATGVSNMAIASTRPPATHPLPHGEDSRLRGHDAGGVGGEAGPASGGSGAVEGPVRIKYRSTLTEENVGYLNKLDQYASRPDSTGRSSERIWRWLEGSGPPFDNPPPSLGVPTVSKTNLASASRRQGTKRSFFSCFNCFGGGGTR